MTHKIFNTIAFRLTLWFTGIFTICSSVAFGLFYFLAVQTIEHQVDQDLLDNAAKFSTIINRNGLLGARDLAVVEAQAAGEKLIFFRLVYPTGEVFASSHMSYWKDVHVDQAALKLLVLEKNNVFETIDIPSNGQKARILYSYVASNAILQTGIAMEFNQTFLSAFKKVFFAAMGFIIVFSAVSGWILVGKTLSGVATITRTAQHITGSTLEARVPVTGSKDELDHLANTFNAMLDRIEDLVRSIREMSDNIAHDLKSPITRIRGFAEIALTHEDNLEDYRIMASNAIEESDRLLDMINTMLVISKADAGEGEFDFKPTSLSDMINNACDLFSPLAEDKQITIFKDVQDPITMTADIRMLQRAFSNLLDNAIKYTPANGEIRVTAVKHDDTVTVKIKDTGIGIAPGCLEKIFDRFFRAESSRTSQGTGLGLSLARTIVRQHKGDIQVSSCPGQGSMFEMTLPIRNFQVI